MSREVFRTVSVDQDNISDAIASHKVILVPEIVMVTNNIVSGWGRWSKVKTEIVINWQIYSIKDELIWIMESKGQREGTWAANEMYPDNSLAERLEQAIDNLFEVSSNQLFISPILRQLEVTAPLYNSYPSMHMDLAKLILNNYIDENDKNQKGLSLLYFAAKFGNPGILEIMISEGIDINGRMNGLNTTALYLANEHNNKECIKLLVENGSDVNFKIKGKPAQIIIAAVNGKEEIARFLLESGAKVPISDEESEAIAITSKMAAEYYREHNNKSEEFRHYTIAREFYEKASKEYEETSKEYNKLYFELKLKKLGKDMFNILLIGILEVGQEYQARESARQSADIRALNSANKMGLSQIETLNLVSQHRSIAKSKPVVTDNRLSTKDYYNKSEKPKFDQLSAKLKSLVKYFADKSADMKKYRDEIKNILEP